MEFMAFDKATYLHKDNAAEIKMLFTWLMSMPGEHACYLLQWELTCQKTGAIPINKREKRMHITVTNATTLKRIATMDKEKK